jgi:hypothetical protein
MIALERRGSTPIAGFFKKKEPFATTPIAVSCSEVEDMDEHGSDGFARDKTPIRGNPFDPCS